MLVVGDDEAVECVRYSSRVSHAESATKLLDGSWAAVAAAVATQRGLLAALPLCALEVALALIQIEAATMAMAKVWLLTTGAHVHGAAHSGLWGLSRSARVEASLPLVCVDGPIHLALAADSSHAELEMALLTSKHLVPRLVHAPLSTGIDGYVTSASHLVTGGTGGLGLLTARWLAQRGANTLTLASRAGRLARDIVNEWGHVQETAVAVCLQRCDTAESAHVRRVLKFGHAFLTTTSVWHGAGVLSDSTLPKQTAGSLVRVYASKMHGAWTLHIASAPMALRTYVLFSSVTALLGGAGQANYSAANVCLDTLAAWRRVSSTASTSVQWGAWAELGMAARGVANERVATMGIALGFGRISLGHGLTALHIAVLPMASSCVGVLQVQWHRMHRDGTAPAFLIAVTPRRSRLQKMATDRQTVYTASLDRVLEMVRRTAGSLVDADAPLMEAGVDSLGAVELRNQLQRAVGEGVALSSTLMFDHPTARQVALHLHGNRPIVAYSGRADDEELGSGRSQVEVAGINVALPRSVSSLGSLRHISRCGHDLLSVIPSSRWDVAQAADDLLGGRPEIASRVRHGGFLRNAQLFEHGFFSISAAEASAMDPQQRQLLEGGYGAFYAAGMAKASLLDSVTAVNVGQWQSEFGTVLLRTPAGRSVYASTGFSCSVTCGRVSFVLGLQGPCASYDTACSASLVANHGSVRALQRLECDWALSAGVNMILDPAPMRGNAVAGFTSVRGRSHTFDVRADGYARGESIDSIACRLCKEDLRAGMLGSAVRQDGRSASLTAPNGQAQQGVLIASAADAFLRAARVKALEAHGTGTALGDPIEAGAVAAVYLAQRSTDLFAIGSLKANAGHTEPGAGLAGTLKLLELLCCHVMSPNAQLRALNSHVAASLRSHETSVLPTQSTSMNMLKADAVGVSSFGYSGTIVHTLLHHARSNGALVVLAVQPINHRRQDFPWLKLIASTSAKQLSMYSTCLVLANHVDARPSHSFLLMRIACIPAAVSEVMTFRSTPWYAVAALLTSHVSASPSLHGMHLFLGLVQHIVSFKQRLQLLLFASGVLASQAASSREANAGTWGLARVLRLERPSLRLQSTEVPHLSATTPFFPILTPTNEAEMARFGTKLLVARLRVCDTSLTTSAVLACGLYTITGGLGGLGLRAASLLSEGGASHIILASRSGTIMRDGQRLEVVLRSIGHVAAVCACDSADMRETHVLSSVNWLTNLLHASGVADTGLLSGIDVHRLQWMYSPKSTALWYLQCAAAITPPETRVLFSSVASGLANVGQGNYAAANACIDAHALTQRARGIATCSVQWPLIGGAGMGAATFATLGQRQVTIAGLAGISLEDYAQCLRAHLAIGVNATCSAQIAHQGDVRKLLQDLNDPLQLRFGELLEQSKLNSTSACHVSHTMASTAITLQGPLFNSCARALVEGQSEIVVHCRKLRLMVDTQSLTCEPRHQNDASFAPLIALLVMLPGIDGSTIHCKSLVSYVGQLQSVRVLEVQIDAYESTLSIGALSVWCAAYISKSSTNSEGVALAGYSAGGALAPFITPKLVHLGVQVLAYIFLEAVSLQHFSPEHPSYIMATSVLDTVPANLDTDALERAMTQMFPTYSNRFRATRKIIAILQSARNAKPDIIGKDLPTLILLSSEMNKAIYSTKWSGCDPRVYTFECDHVGLPHLLDVAERIGLFLSTLVQVDIAADRLHQARSAFDRTYKIMERARTDFRSAWRSRYETNAFLRAEPEISNGSSLDCRHSFESMRNALRKSELSKYVAHSQECCFALLLNRSLARTRLHQVPNIRKGAVSKIINLFHPSNGAVTHEIFDGKISPEQEDHDAGSLMNLHPHQDNGDEDIRCVIRRATQFNAKQIAELHSGLSIFSRLGISEMLELMQILPSAQLALSSDSGSHDGHILTQQFAFGGEGEGNATERFLSTSKEMGEAWKMLEFHVKSASRTQSLCDMLLDAMLASADAVGCTEVVGIIQHVNHGFSNISMEFGRHLGFEMYAARGHRIIQQMRLWPCDAAPEGMLISFRSATCFTHSIQSLLRLQPLIDMLLLAASEICSSSEGLTADTILAEMQMKSIEWFLLSAKLSEYIGSRILPIQMMSCGRISTLAQCLAYTSEACAETCHAHIVGSTQAEFDSESLTSVVLKHVRELSASASHISVDMPLMENIDSLGAAELSSLLASHLQVQLSATLVFDAGTTRNVALILSDLLNQKADICEQDLFMNVPTTPPTQSCYIQGLAVQCFEAKGIAMLWQMIEAVTEGFVSVSEHRWIKDLEGPSGAHYGCFLPHGLIETFDASMFDISPKEASYMDPQQRLVIDVSYDTLHQSQRRRQELLGSDTGVAIAFYPGEFMLLLLTLLDDESTFLASGSTPAVCCGRVSFTYGLQGPSLAVETSCSSSLVAHHCALQSIKMGASLEQLVSGVQLQLMPISGTGLASAGLLSPSGRERVFDRNADGYVRCEVCCSIFLSQKEPCILIPGASAVQSDGRSASLSAPNGVAQKKVMNAALYIAGLSEWHYVEAHGTGTVLGDPTEMNSISRVAISFRSQNKVAVTGVKANVGHSEMGAGLLGYMKACKTLETHLIITNAQLHVLNPHVESVVSNSHLTFPVQNGRGPPIGAVCTNSFGFNGTIACAHAHAHYMEVSIVRHVLHRGRPFLVWNRTGRTVDKDKLNAVQGPLNLHDAVQIASSIVGNHVNADVPLMDAGLDSNGAIELRNLVQTAGCHGTLLSSTVVFDFPTLRELSAHLSYGFASSTRAEMITDRESNDQQIAFAGYTVRTSHNLALAGLLCGTNSVGEVPEQRWCMAQATSFLSDVAAARSRHGGFLDNISLFDNVKFSISLMEACSMDPQQRCVIEEAYAALHSARWITGNVTRGSNIGVFVGIQAFEFQIILKSTPMAQSAYSGTSTAHAVACGRVSFALDLQGPCASYDTACSAGLVSVHAAVSALTLSECAAGLTVGVNLMLLPDACVGCAMASMSSLHGRCHTFDFRADGYARSEACCAKALACEFDGQLQRVEVSNIAVRQDGRSATLTAPSGHAQLQLRFAVDSKCYRTGSGQLQDTMIEEAHGTGTALGDPIEANSYAAVARRLKSTLSMSTLGSVKANMGHAEPAAGSAGLFKVILHLTKCCASPNAQLRVLNEFVRPALTNLRTACNIHCLRESTSLGALNSFGFGGTIARAVVQKCAQSLDSFCGIAQAVVGLGRAFGTRPPGSISTVFHRHRFSWRDPVHPLAQNHHVNPDGELTYRSPTAGAMHRVASDHVVQKRVIFPGAGYLECARCVGSMGSPGTTPLRDVYFLQPLELESSSLIIECKISGERFEIRSSESTLLEEVVHCSGAVAARRVGCVIVNGALQTCPRAADAQALYASYFSSGLQYGPTYRTLFQAWAGRSNAQARLRTRGALEGLDVHPADLDDAQCSSGFIDSSSDGKTHVPFAVNDVLLTRCSGKLWAVRVQYLRNLSLCSS